MSTSFVYHAFGATTYKYLTDFLNVGHRGGTKEKRGKEEKREEKRDGGLLTS